MRFVIKHSSLPFLISKLARIKSNFEEQDGALEWEILDSHIEYVNYGSNFNPSWGTYDWTQVPVEVDVVEVTGELTNNEWEVVAIVYKQEDGRVTIKTIKEDVQIPHEYYASQIRCDHCNTRAQRKKGVIIRNTNTQEFKIIGSGCLKEYTGISLAALKSLYSFDDTVVEEANRIRSSAFVENAFIYETKEVLSDVLAIQDTHPTAFGTSMRLPNMVAQMLFAIHYPTFLSPSPRVTEGLSFAQRYLTSDPSAYADKAQEIREWIKGLDLESTKLYKQVRGNNLFEELSYEEAKNLQTLASEEHLKHDDVAFLALLPNIYKATPAYAVHQEEEAAREAEREARRAASVLGEVGQEYTVTVKDISTVGPKYSSRTGSYFYIATGTTEAGQTVSWFTNNELSADELTIKGKLFFAGEDPYSNGRIINKFSNVVVVNSNSTELIEGTMISSEITKFSCKQSAYGNYYFGTATCADGNTYTFSSNNYVTAEVGQTLKGKVKGKNEYRGKVNYRIIQWSIV